MSKLMNVFDEIPDGLPEELLQTILEARGVRIQRIVSLGHASPEGFWYDQDSAEWVLLLTGGARLGFDGREPMDLKPGDFVNIPAHQRHRVEWTLPDGPTVWLAIHYDPGLTEAS